MSSQFSEQFLKDAEDRKKANFRVGSIDETLRDRFAMAALTGLLASRDVDKLPKDQRQGMSENYAKVSYVIADAMMDERKV